jgi:hypothetical protein
LDRYGRGREEFRINLGRHQKGSNCCATNEVHPDPEDINILKGLNGQKTNGCSDGTASIDKSSDGTERLVASTYRRVRCQISSNGGSNDIVGTVENKGIVRN